MYIGKKNIYGVVEGFLLEGSRVFTIFVFSFIFKMAFGVLDMVCVESYGN